MKKMAMAIMFLLFLMVFVPTEIQAVSVTNITTVFQGNFCFDCNSMGQLNRSLIRQNITFGPKWFVPEHRSLLVNTLTSIATISQSNICTQCRRVLQRNSTVVVQRITTPRFVSTPLKPAVSASGPTFIENLSEVSQGNLCVECNFSRQINSNQVRQDIRLLDPVAIDGSDSTGGTHYSLFSNFTRVEQTNFCVFCENTLQRNLAFVVQNISTAPEPGTLLLLGSGLAGLYGLARKKLI